MTNAGSVPERRAPVGEKLASKRGSLGIMQAHPNTVFTELAGFAGYDFVVLDCEHGLFSDLDIVAGLHAAAGTGISVFVRARDAEPKAIGRYLDMGVDGLLVPGVTSAKEAGAVARATRYAPAGTRGFAPSSHRATRYGLETERYLGAPRDQAVLLVLVETAQAIDNLGAILALDGIDGAIIGPSDLTANLGALGDFAHPDYLAAIARFEAAAAASAKPFGIPPHPGQPLEALAERGHRFFIIGSDIGLIRQGMLGQLNDAAAKLSSSGTGP